MKLHQLRNVTDRFTNAVASTGGQADADRLPQPHPLVAQAALEALVRELDRSRPGAAGSLREGLAKTLTIGRLAVPRTLARTLRSTNPIWVLS